MAVATRKIKQYGLTELYISPDKPALVDIVLVHGLNGHPKDSWTSKNGDVFWPVDVLPQFLGSSRVRVLTYGYNANVTSFTDGASKDRIHHHAETLASELYANRSLRGFLERPIIFVCHSLGGLVVKRCMIACRSQENDKLRHLRSIYISTFGILFLGTPHTGSDVAKWGLLLQKICSAVLPKKFMDSSPQLIEALRSNNEVLQNINRLFNDFFSRFHIYFFHETRPLDLKGTREFVVDEASAAPDIEGAERMGIEADHNSMAKFEDDSSPGFEAVAEAIIRYSRDAPAVIAGRWVEEKAHVQLQNRSKADELTRSTIDLSQGPLQSEAETTRMGNSVPNLPLPPIFSPEPTPRMSQSVEVLSPQRGPLFVVPPGFHPNSTFIGMEKELSELHIRLFKSRKREERVAAVLICGGPGSGKSHLARQYVHIHRKDFPGGIFWIDAKSFLLMSTCYWDVARAAALTNSGDDSKYPASTDAAIYVDQVRHWFESKEEWLIVFDGLNFDEDSQLNAFKKYLPFRKNTSIIYTSVDRTLAKKQRLFEPYCLTVRPLKVDDARQLLFDDLDIKKPTAEQWKKATEIVNHYQGLPLAIHAISHRLRATRKPLERYHINSHLTDHRLAEPFIGIMHDLSTNEHIEAINLINLLAFFGHHIPVGMLSWGKSALATQNISILTSSRPGEPGDIDNTLGVLIQYGLIERISDPYPGKSLLPCNDKEGKAESPDSEHSGSDSFTESMSVSGIYQSSIDVIKIHSVVQTFFRDELKILDGKHKQQHITIGPGNDGLLQQKHAPSTQPGADFPGYFLGWLLNATKVFCRSYDNARYKMSKDRTGSLFIKDLREYETHAERLMGHYKKIDTRPSTLTVKEAKKFLKDAVRDIKVEIGKISPNSCEDSLRHEKSIFNRSSSSSSGPSSSMEDSIASQRSTFYGGDWESVKVQSPVEISLPENKPSSHFPLATMYRETLEEKNDGYLSDGEGLKSRTRRSSASSSRYSQNTEKPPSTSATVTSPTSPALPAAIDGSASGDSGWETVRRKKKGNKPQEPSERRSRFRGRLNRDLGSYRPSPVTKVSSAQGEGSMSRPSSAAPDKGLKSHNAKDILASFHKPDVRKFGEDERVSPPVLPTYQKENQSPWILPTAPTQGARFLKDMSHLASGQSAPSVLDRHKKLSAFTRPRNTVENRLGLQMEFNMEVPSSAQSSSIPSPISAEFGKGRPNPLSYSDPSLVRAPIHRDAGTVPGSRNHSRNSSALAPYGREAVGNSVPPQTNQTHLAFTPRPNANEFSSTPLRYIPVSDSGTFEVQKRNERRSQNLEVYPSFLVSGSPPQQAIPGGYTSEPLSAAMSRDPSGQSRISWQTDPNPLSRPVSQPPLPNTYGSQLPTSRSTSLWYAPERTTPMSVGSSTAATAYVYPVVSPPAEVIGSSAPLSSRFEYGGEPETTAPAATTGRETIVKNSIYFGGHKVDVEEARQRVLDWNLRQPSTMGFAGSLDPRTGQAPRMQPQISDPGTIPVPVPVPVPIPIATPSLSGRSRSGSCPPEPIYSELGLGIDVRFSPPTRNR
ncbi:hypothetical protein UA08_01515 [Talaromyces atroroseus]|uniref:AB hydrolase-1 domain-containing protein n=1 Tax=Talaromyces atroroseus TaxID=1441469 RepID=A0A1Q5QBS4_TALAT|nr:hypothetical protein UA08_01515 [Talaromyces atroroseus]OKL63384.1 hypothetical protein UA08_01515 [Talaromyces atroroseus]